MKGLLSRGALHDLIALTTIVGCFILIAIGRNHLVVYLLITTVTAYGIGKGIGSDIQRH